MANHYATALNATPSYGERFGKKLLTLTLIATPLGFLLAGMGIVQKLFFLILSPLTFLLN